MDPLASGQLKTTSVTAGKLNATGVARGGVQQQVKKQEAPVQARPLQLPQPIKEGGVKTEELENGQVRKSSDSGMTVLKSEGGQQIELPSGEAFRWNEDGVSSLHPEGPKDATLTQTSDGLPLISFQDKDQNTVQIQPDSMTFEVLNKQKNLAQVYHPDGHQEVVAFGRFRDAENGVSNYEHHAVYSPSGELVDSSGFPNLEVNGNKLSFDLGNGVRTERNLIKPLPGQEPFEASRQATDTASAGGINPLTIFGDQPLLGATNLSGTTVGTVDTTYTGSSTEEVANQKAEALALKQFAALPDISKDFFAGADGPGVSFVESKSGLVTRDEGSSRAFLLPNGDSFRTDGQHLEVVGESPRAKNARLVTEGEAQLLAYSDGDDNRYTIDINSGDYEVSNRQGTLTQGFKADGTTEYGVRGTYTSESGKPQQYFNKATLGETGTLLSKVGFDDLKVSGDSLKFTLPNGVETDRKLVEAAELPVDIPKKLVLSAGIAAEWGGALALADELMNPTAAKAPEAAASMEKSAAPVAVAADNAATIKAPARSPGAVRTALPDGSGTATTLPNGLVVVDGKEAYATDATGNRLPVQKSQMASESADSYFLTVNTPDGAAYTVSNKNLDMMVMSADGKVYQMVSPTGKVLTSILDNGRQHLHELDPAKGANASPGVRLDPRYPDRLVVEGVGSYPLPHPFGEPAQGVPGGTEQAPATGAGQVRPGQVPTGQNGPAAVENGGESGLRDGYTAGPGGVQQGFRPSFWQRLKGAFLNENPWDSSHANLQPGQSLPQNARPYPGNYQQYDPMAAQMQQIERSNQTMMMANMGMGLMNQMSVMNMMFFSPFGMF